MVIRVKSKAGEDTERSGPGIFAKPFVSYSPFAKVPAITGSPIRTPNIIIRAVKIMLMDIRMLLQPKQTAQELENYSRFAELARGKR